MTTLSTSRSSRSLQGRGVPGWMRSISLRRVGIMVLILALLFTIVSYTLHAMLNYPEILLDKASFAKSLLAQGETAALLGFMGLLLCGILLFVISLALVPYLEEKRRRSMIITGGASGICWAVGALMGLTLVPLWASALTNVAQVLATILFVLAEVATPLLLLFWTMTLARQFRALGVLGVPGLLLVLLRSLVWGLNAILPIASGFYGTAGIGNILAVLAPALRFPFAYSAHDGSAVNTTGGECKGKSGTGDAPPLFESCRGPGCRSRWCCFCGGENRTDDCQSTRSRG